MKKGFTLAELLVVTFIIIFLSALIFPNYRAGEENFALQRSAQKLAQDIRKTQQMAMSAEKFKGGLDLVSFKGVYGIKFQTDSSNYTLFADLNNDQSCEPEEEIENLSLEKKVKISSLSPSSPLNNTLIITFTPPDPQTNINPTSSLASIILTNNGQTKTIKVNKAGLIYVE